MKTVLLARTAAEGAAYARGAGLRRGEFVIGSSAAQANPATLLGIQLDEADLVVEFPGFRDGPNAAKVLEVMKSNARKAHGAGPEWVMADGRSRT